MYNTIKKIISAGGYKLAEMQAKIKKLYVLGDLDEAQADELLALAVTGAQAEAERPESLEMVKQLAARIEALEARVAALDGGTVGETVSGYPVWVPWNGISADYTHGAIVSHNGVLWQSVFAGQNVWEPGAVGTNGLWVTYSAR